MKAFILIVMINASGSPASVSMERFANVNACQGAALAVTQQCKTVNVDGYDTQVCYTRPNIEAFCQPAS